MKLRRSHTSTYLVLATMIVGLWQTTCYGEEQRDVLAKCETLLPPKVKSALDKSYYGWKIVEREDLTKDDQDISNEKCPGIVFGAFGPNSKSIAILLGRRANDLYQVRLLLAKPLANTDFKLIELLSEHAYRYPIIHKGAPGVYSDFYDEKKSVTVHSETLIFEHLEASAKAFYIDNGAYRYVLVSD